MRSRAPGARWPHRHTIKRLCDTEGSAILEFAITIPLLVVFVVGIYDFSGAFNQKQKIEQAAQEGAIVAGAEPMTDVTPASSNTPAAGPASLQPVVVAIFNSLAASGVLPNANQGTCTVSSPLETQAVVTYTYTIMGCSSYSTDNLVITINRGWIVAGTSPVPSVVGTTVAVKFPYHWRFNSVIQVLIPGASYQAITNITETASVHNQM